MTGPNDSTSGNAGTRTETAADDRTDEPTQALRRDAQEPGAAQAGAVPRAGARPAADSGPGWGPGASPAAQASGEKAADKPADKPADTPSDATTVLPGAAATGAAARRPVPPRPVPRGEGRPPLPGTRPAAGRSRRAKLALRRVDPWSVFLFSLVASVFLGIALIVAVAVLYAVITRLGIVTSLNELFSEVTGGDPTAEPLLTSSRIVGGAAVLAAVNIVFLTLLATLSALLYNLCASFTGGIEVTLGERD